MRQMQCHERPARPIQMSGSQNTEEGDTAVRAAVAAFARGEFVVVIDDEDRENEGDLIVAAETVTSAQMAFLVRHTSGLACVAMDGQRLDQLRLEPMVAMGDDPRGTAFTVSVDLREGTTTGISASDRASTIRALSDPAAGPDDFTRPGHVFPLRARPGGVLKRAGHTEAAVDLARLAGKRPAGVLAEIVNDDGTVARRPQLAAFARRHGLIVLTIADLIRYRQRTERLVERTSQAPLPTPYGTFDAFCYTSLLDGTEHLALVAGDVAHRDEVLVRVHSECLTGDLLGSARCDCGEQLRQALREIAEAGSGVLVYLRGQEGRGIGLGHKLRAYTLQDQGLDTVDANLALGLPVDSREYGVGAQILADLGVHSIRLMTNNPAKYSGLSGYDITIASRVPLIVTAGEHNADYLMTKRDRLGHQLDPACGTRTTAREQSQP
ncbi:bifunctional 3,4-dihydroxy-2-butanone-4-phosphate synthase/GTP cyclohydrolase II [Amycolatopsis nalaikhensis]|uniref:Riboflavin biosynthesis protein RibBA n=2 Tax=Amycolatopsis nalaikhensis TaxID=715472 RepID=A0ABY8XZ21_9PSEU|nr:bifunctional 3,4-dihydroxy-2-butanone-4-phosphate synthase/GTP cyclohydrolase II [Amycolatopsis sp. 2-2]WIV60868.1 bifunctional 3,4-dihydroxy-2-butanone-4-phosphate synthase/GTP cyclohydrolase II [Amycolatopsis sp. 2-2]